MIKLEFAKGLFYGLVFYAGMRVIFHYEQSPVMFIYSIMAGVLSSYILALLIDLIRQNKSGNK